MTEEITPDGSKDQKKKSKAGGSPIAGFRQWLLDSYNGIFKIVVQPLLPKMRLTGLVLIGVIFGLIWAYNVRPTQFYNAGVHQLSEGARDQWVKFVASSYDAELYNAEQARQFLQQVEEPEEVITRLISAESGQVQASLQRLQAEVTNIGNGRSAPGSGSFFGSIMDFILALIVYLIIINLFAILWGLLIGGFVERGISSVRKRIFGETEEDKKSREVIEGIRRRKELEEQMKEEAANEATTSTLGPPIMQRISPYQRGRAFDDSFAIEDANDMFLGECGATIAKTLGDTQELAAIEIWLFDKDDFVRTFTKLFVSEHIYNDPVARSELDAKVENPATDIVVASAGATIVLESGNIRCQAKIAELNYGSTAGLPPNSHFESATLRMEAWEIEGGGSSAPAPAPVPAAASGLPSLDSYEIGPPPQMPSGSTTGPTTPAMPPASPAGSRPLDSYEIGPPPEMPSSMSPPPPPASVPDDDDDPFGGTGDFTPIG